jgi:hypothetical protein
VIGATVGRPMARFIEEKLEAPPGFEPGVEVLQTGSAITKLLSRFAFWSALIPRFGPFLGVVVPKLLPRLGGGFFVGFWEQNPVRATLFALAAQLG